MISKISLLLPKSQNKLFLVASIIYATISLLMPTFAVIIINQDWSFYLEFLGVSFKPWRLFLLACGLPSLMCALILHCFLPESPKFTFSQGDEEGTLDIMRKMFRTNTGLSSYEFGVTAIVKDKEFNDCARKNENLFKSMWNQSVPLFHGKHLRNILTASFINFSVCLSANGFWTFLPEMLNKVSIWDDLGKEPATICEIFHESNVTKAADGSSCLQKLELSTFIYTYENVVLFGACYAVMSLMINRAGKLSILLMTTIACGLAALWLMFLEIVPIISHVYIFMTVATLGISVVNASTVELFPTKMRAMAICVSMMIGRLGSSAGSVIIGLIIDKYCTFTFLMPVVLLFTSAALACTIPNISKRQK